LDAANKKLAANEKLKSERDDLERQLRDTKSSKLSTEQGQPVPNEESQHLRSENTTLQQQLKGVEVNRNQIQIELQETQMELDGLKQNLEEAERIETQNEELVARLKSMSDELAGVKDLQEELKACKSDKKDQEQLVRCHT
jgi:chromosome segregation ATPase